MTQKIDLTDKENYFLERDKYDNSFVSRLTHKQRVMIHPILLSIIEYRNKKNGFKIKTISDNRTETSKPKIYCITHIGKFDIEVVSEIIKDHYYLLSGDFENIKGTIEEKFLGFNGVIYVREDDKEDRKKSKEKMIATLKNGGNLMYFPEGTWNLSPNLPVLPCPYGIIEVAMKSGATIVPVAIEQYGNTFIANIGENFNVEKYNINSKIDAIEDLRGEMATLKWQIWETVPFNIRSCLSEEEFDLFIDERLKEWPNFTLEEFYSRVFRAKNNVSEQDVYSFFENLNINKNNTFLAKAKVSYQKRYLKTK